MRSRALINVIEVSKPNVSATWTASDPIHKCYITSPESHAAN